MANAALLTIGQLDGLNPTALVEYFYDDGVAWGIGTVAEVPRDAEGANAPLETLRFKLVRG